MSVRWLIDKSALARAGKPQVARVLTPRIDGGLIAISVVTELEVGFSARSTSDHDDILGLLDPAGPDRAAGSEPSRAPATRSGSWSNGGNTVRSAWPICLFAAAARKLG